MKERSLVLIKPGFVSEPLIKELEQEILDDDLYILKEGPAKYSLSDSMLHYKNKKNEDYYLELSEYLASDELYGIVVQGEEAITKLLNLKDAVRRDFPDKYNLETTKMKNIIHTSDSRLSASEEIKVFLHAKAF